MKQYPQLAIPLLIAAACSAGDQRIPTAPDLVATSVRQAAGPSISVTALPSLGGASTARAINDAQVIVGTSNGLPVKWTLAPGSWQVQPLQSASGDAQDITESGDIVGSSAGSVILWTSGGVTEKISAGYPEAINESQVVVGLNYPAGGGNGAKAWTRSTTGGWVEHTLPMLAGVSSGLNEPRDINDDGVIVGFAEVAPRETRAVKWVPSSITLGEWDPPVLIDNQTAKTSGALGIVGQEIVGEILRCPSSTCFHQAFYWTLPGTQATALGSENAWAEGLNAQGSIVGSVFTRQGLHGFVWTLANPTIRDLGIAKGFQSASAYDINNPTGSHTSQAVGEASGAKGKHVAMLWTIP